MWYWQAIAWLTALAVLGALLRDTIGVVFTRARRR